MRRGKCLSENALKNPVLAWLINTHRAHFVDKIIILLQANRETCLTRRSFLICSMLCGCGVITVGWWRLRGSSKQISQKCVQALFIEGCWEILLPGEDGVQLRVFASCFQPVEYDGGDYWGWISPPQWILGSHVSFIWGLLFASSKTRVNCGQCAWPFHLVVKDTDEYRGEGQLSWVITPSSLHSSTCTCDIDWCTWLD